LRARNSAHSHNLLIYASCVHSFAEGSQVHSKSAAASNQKGQGKAGESATLSPKIPGNRPTPVFTSFCQSLPLISSYLKLCSRDIPHLSCSSLLTSGSYAYIFLKVSQSHICPYRYITDTYHCLNSQTAARSLDLTNYKLSKYAGTFTSPQYRLVYHTIKQAIMHSKVATSSKA